METNVIISGISGGIVGTYSAVITYYFFNPPTMYNQVDMMQILKAVMDLDDSQLLRGILEGCVLGIIAQGETYGYEILSVLEKAGFENLLEGTLYPVLTRLEKKGLIACRKAKSPFGPIRKYYSITDSGGEYFDQFKESYSKLIAASGKILDGTVTKEEHENGQQL